MTMKRILYHGSILEIPRPSVSVGRPDLDFGQGFYLTDIREQAEKWAFLISGKNPDSSPILNIYEFDDEGLSGKYNILTFKSYDQGWLDFIVSNRMGRKSWMAYDMVEGGIANDRVIDTVENYMAGTMPAEIALRLLSLHQPNNQVCIINQEIVDKHLIFIRKEDLYA